MSCLLLQWKAIMFSSFKNLDFSLGNLVFFNSAGNCPRSTQTVPHENVFLFLRSSKRSKITLQLSPCSASSVSDFPVYI